MQMTNTNVARLSSPALMKLFLILTAMPFATTATAADDPPPMQAVDILGMSPEQLANIQVMSVSKQSEALSDAPASVFVITADAIRRSGATTLTEALKLAPNLQVVSDINIPGYVTARGHNGGDYTGPNKLLVLIDGRSVYTPLFSGVFWDQQDVMLEDIDRIEVISGPAGTLWGSNAVNGVINVTTRSARQTQGTLVAATAGNMGTDFSFRYGGTSETGAMAYRVYGKTSERGNSVNALTNRPVEDKSHMSSMGFRTDWERQQDQVSVQGNAYRGGEDQPPPGSITNVPNLKPIGFSGANLTSRWTRALNDGSSITVQGYLDHTERSVPPAFSSSIDTVDLEVQHSIRTKGIHSVIWGANYRHTWDRTQGSIYFGFSPGNVQQNLVSVFAQDEIRLHRTLRLTIGARAERNAYGVNEVLPSARLAWKFSPDHLLWTAYSRTVRAPSRIDADILVPDTRPLNGNPTPTPESAKVYELGYRGQLGQKGTFAVTAFHANYDNLTSVRPAPGFTAFFTANALQATNTGIEAWSSYQLHKTWKISVGYTAMRETFVVKPGQVDLGSGPALSGNDPAHTWLLRSSHDLGNRTELDISFRHAASLTLQAVPAFTAIDARIAWKLSKDLEFSITGRNLFGTAHAEYGDPAFRGTMPTQVFAKVVFRK